MDASQLLNTQIPFDQAKLNLLDQVTNTFYTTTNQQDREIANKILNQFQELDESFTYCDFILKNTQNIYTKVLALGIIEKIVKTKWNLLEENNRIAIRNFLVDILIKNVTDTNLFNSNNFFINKLNIVIVAIAKNEWTSTWPKFISELCLSSKTNQNLCENNMKLLQLLSEEINEFWKNSLTTQKAYELKAKMSSEFLEVFNLCQFIFDNSQNVSQSLLIESIKLFAEYTVWFPIEYVFNEKIINQFLINIKDMPFIRVEVIKCIGAIFNINFENKIQPGQDNQQYFQIKNYIMGIYKTFMDQMLAITNGTDFSERHKKIDPSKLSGFERLTLQFELALINFFKNNFRYIESFDTQISAGTNNEFANNFMNEIVLGLGYMTQFLLIQNDEIFKSACEFWYWFTFKLVFLREINSDPESEVPPGFFENSLVSYISYTNNMYFYRNFFVSLIDRVRNTIIIKMNKPLEVKIDIDENGDLTTDPTSNTVYQSLHDTMQKTLVFLTHLDYNKTQEILEKSLTEQLENAGKKLNRSLLNSLSWSVGCITGAMDETLERQFVVKIIRILLTLCEQTKGKDNKAVCASNIMYVVGQYPRFLNKYWNFLKTVVKKLFEFMHECHPGVQDFACETFLKISMKCGEEFIKIQDNEQEPYINVLVRTVSQDTQDLCPHQKLMFYEALGNMINLERDNQKKLYLIEKLMQPTYSDWLRLFDQAGQNADVLKNTEVVKALELIIRINERVSYSTKTVYWGFGSKLFENMLKSYIFYTKIVNDSFNAGEMINTYTKSYQSFNKTLLKYFCSLISNTQNQQIIMNEMLPGLGQLIEAYSVSHIDNRDPNVLLVFTRVLENLKSTQYNYIVSIWKYLCLFTLNMIKNDFNSFPEHRMNFFILLKALISNAFDALFQVQESNFNKDVIDAITWAIRHNQPLMYETGLETLLILLKNVSAVKIVNGINIADPFCKTYFFGILNDVLYVLTDSFHKGGFRLQVEIIQSLIQIVETGLISENLFDPNVTNKMYVMTQLCNTLTSAFTNLNKNQIEAFCIALFNSSYSAHEFKVCIRDFLVTLKSFSKNDDELYAEEKNKQLEMAKQLEQKKKQMIPGMQPVYDAEFQKKVSSSNYQDKEMN